jgi:hypothetical protein
MICAVCFRLKFYKKFRFLHKSKKEMKGDSSSKGLGGKAATAKVPDKKKRDREDFEKALESNGSFADLGLSPRVVEALVRIPK